MRPNPEPDMTKTVTIVRNVLEANERRAGKLKDYFDERKILCLNLMSSPGAGKIGRAHV